MAARTFSTVSWFRLVLTSAIICSTIATPTVMLPFNDQVPQAAFANQQYSYQFPESTFGPPSGDLTYELSDGPDWLTLESSSRTLSGLPTPGNVGINSFVLTARDQSGYTDLNCTLAVSVLAAPQIATNITSDITGSVIIAGEADHPSVTVLPREHFWFAFANSSFDNNAKSPLFHYATLANHTPLPSWLSFDPQHLNFTGKTPALATYPQTWAVNLIASNDQGFAGTNITFNVTIGIPDLAFVPRKQHANATIGSLVSFHDLHNELYFNNSLFDVNDLQSAEAFGAAWMNFDPATLNIWGKMPNNATRQEVVVVVHDRLGNQACAIVNFVPTSSLLTYQTGAMQVTPGETFDLPLANTTIQNENATLTIEIPPSVTSWLHYDASSQELQGSAPNITSVQHVTLTAIASNADTTQSTLLTLDVQAKPTASAVYSPHPAGTPAPSSPAPKLAGGTIAAIVVSAIVLAAILGALIMAHYQRKLLPQKRPEDEQKKRSSLYKGAVKLPSGDAKGDAIDRGKERGWRRPKTPLAFAFGLRSPGPAWPLRNSIPLEEAQSSRNLRGDGNRADSAVIGLANLPPPRNVTELEGSPSTQAIQKSQPSLPSGASAQKIHPAQRTGARADTPYFGPNHFGLQTSMPPSGQHTAGYSQTGAEEEEETRPQTPSLVGSSPVYGHHAFVGDAYDPYHRHRRNISELGGERAQDI